MSKTVVIHQPDFLPYLGFFHRFLLADLWVVFDDVQFLAGSKSWHNRDKIKTAQGAKWLTVGVKKAPRGIIINEIYLSDNGWEERSLNLLKENYKKAPFFDEIFPRIEKLYSHDCVKLVDFNMRSIEMLMNIFDIKIETVFASTLKASVSKTERLVDLCKKVGATAYLTGSGSRAYLQESPFEAEGIKVIWQDFKHPVYPQLHGEFLPYLSSIDLLFNCGIEKSREILRYLAFGDIYQCGTRKVIKDEVSCL